MILCIREIETWRNACSPSFAARRLGNVSQESWDWCGQLLQSRVNGVASIRERDGDMMHLV